MNLHFPTIKKLGSEPRIALYSHDTMGLGHLRRNILIASILAESPINANVLVVSGAREACHFAMMAGVDCVTLPSLCKDVSGDYTGKHLRWTFRETTSLRSKILASTLNAFSPDVFIVDKVPRGIGNELDEALADIGEKGTTRCVLGLREILDDPATVMKQWIECDAEKTIRDHYDEVWIYGDSAIYDSVQQYAFGCETADRCVYTGFLDQSRRINPSIRRNCPEHQAESIAVCVIGGGQDGMQLASAFASARMPLGWKGILITGPFLPEADRMWLRQTVASKSDCELVENLVEADGYISQADRVVSMAGYNTIASILSFEKPALVVPRMAPRREQWIRANELARHGLLTTLSPDDLTPRAITDWIECPDVPKPTANSVDLGGLDRIVESVNRWLPQRSASSTQPSEVSIV
ncbi:glycosyltransferase family protein [Stieleria varia]|uniref:MurG-like transferase n=1 Tax=Stieleria varia TaxID=2528005 RepID=A0A5C6B6P3_9BACT|nr:glycosyltransferase [Stieleria varia]TWU06194.1 MurG-like transferase [Stieleria varia]